MHHFHTHVGDLQIPCVCKWIGSNPHSLNFTKMHACMEVDPLNGMFIGLEIDLSWLKFYKAAIDVSLEKMWMGSSY